MNKLTTFELAEEIIGQALIDFMQLSKDNPKERKCLDAINNLLNYARDGYCLVQWDESQKYMEEEWFQEEAILDIEEKFGPSAYFIPIKRLIEEE